MYLGVDPIPTSSAPATRHWTAPAAGNDASCGPEPRTGGRFAPPRWEVLFQAGEGYVASPDEPMFGWATSYELFQAARVRRAAVMVAFLHAAMEAVRESTRRAWEGYRRRQQSRSIYNALGELDDRTLRDLGFHRCEIGSVAAEAVGNAEHTRLHVTRLPRTPA